VTEVGETAAGADAAREGISQPAGRGPDWTPFCTRWEDKCRGGIQPKADSQGPRRCSTECCQFWVLVWEEDAQENCRAHKWDRRGEGELRVSRKVSRGEKRVTRE
jgi:hypothetical protein